MRLILAAAATAAALSLSACANPESDYAVTTTSGQVLGAFVPQQIEQDTGLLGVNGEAEADRFTRRERLMLIDRYVEFLRMEDGYLSYEQLYATGYVPYWHNAAIIDTVKEKYRTEQGLEPGDTPLKTGRNSYGLFQYTTFTSNGKHCFIFGQVFGAPGRGRNGSPGDKEFRGARCVDADSPESGTLERDMLQVVQNLEVEG